MCDRRSGVNITELTRVLRESPRRTIDNDVENGGSVASHASPFSFPFVPHVCYDVVSRLIYQWRKNVIAYVKGSASGNPKLLVMSLEFEFNTAGRVHQAELK